MIKKGKWRRLNFKTIVRNAQDLMKMLGDDDNLPEWVQNKITKQTTTLISATDYLKSKGNEKMKKFKDHQADEIDCKCESMYEDLEITEMEYQGKKVTLNDPVRGGTKKFYVYTKNEKGNVVKVSSVHQIWKSKPR